MQSLLVQYGQTACHLGKQNTSVLVMPPPCIQKPLLSVEEEEIFSILLGSSGQSNNSIDMRYQEEKIGTPYTQESQRLFNT